ncbi:MAG: hypothetical protein ACREXR_12375 [Gammaproteobacteria bacterium]
MIANPSYYRRDPNVPDSDLPLGTVTSVERLEYLAPIKRIAWGAVFAGVVLAIGIQVLLNMLGTGIGASTIDPLRGNTPDAEVLGISAAVWWILASLIALFVGGWTAARLAGMPRQVDGMLHGLLTWGLSTLVVFYCLGTIVGGLIGGTFNLISGGVAAVAPQVADAVASEADLSWENIRQEARQLLRQTGNPNLQPEALERRAQQAPGVAMSDQEIDSLLGRMIRQGEAVASEVDREEVVNVLMARTDMNREEATRIVDNWIKTFERARVEANQQARQVADTTADAVAKASIWGFLALLIGAAAAGCGGIIGTPRTPPIAP